MSELSSLKNSVLLFNDTLSLIEDDIVLCDMDLSGDDVNVLESDLCVIKDNLEKLKFEVLLSGEFDRNNCYIEIHSGAGGTESNDWANMIKRMYVRYFEKSSYKFDVLSEQPGEEVGIIQGL